MKRFVAAILAVLYLGTSIGATVHLHYCMGKLMSWALMDKDSKNCSFCGMPKAADGGHCVAAKDGCCKDQQKLIKVKGDHKVAELAVKFSSLSFDAILGIHRGLPERAVCTLLMDYPVCNAPTRHWWRSCFPS
jgi:hypothetical protein